MPEPPKRVRDAAANCRTGTAEAAEFSSRATAAAADFGGAVCNVECMFGMTGYGKGRPAVGQPLVFIRWLRLFFRHEEQIETLVRHGADPVVVHADRGREIGVGLQESAAVYAVENVVGELQQTAGEPVL